MTEKIKQFLKKFPAIYFFLEKTWVLYHDIQSWMFFGRVQQSQPQDIIKFLLDKKQSVFFIQIGSNDGLQGDPLHKLIVDNKEWKGIFVEPVKFAFDRLVQTYKKADRFVFENVAIGMVEGEYDFFYVSEDAKIEEDNLPFWYDQLGSFNRQHILNHFNGRLEPYIVSEKIKCVTLEEIFQRNNVEEIDLLHIDTEGSDYKVISQLDCSIYYPSIILFEHIHLAFDERRKAHSLLRKRGYKLKSFRMDTLAILKAHHE